MLKMKIMTKNHSRFEHWKVDRFHRIKDSKYSIPQSVLRGTVVPCHVQESQFLETKLAKWIHLNLLYSVYLKLMVIKLHKNFKSLFLDEHTLMEAYYKIIIGIIQKTFDVCLTMHQWYNNIDNQLDATITVHWKFQSAQHASGDDFAHPQEH